MPHHYTLPIVTELLAVPVSGIAIASTPARGDLVLQPPAPAPVKAAPSQETQLRQAR
jgi:hypothetical protein